MRQPLLLALAAALVWVNGAVVDAHHSYAEFRDEMVSLEGAITALEFANPHTTVTLRTKDATVYTLTWNARFQLASMGVNEADLKVGDNIAVIAYPHRDAGVHQLAKLRELRRPSDGWTWRSTKAPGERTNLTVETR